MQTMNPLFLGLLIAGVVLVIGVVLINWLQERRVRRRIDAAFRKPANASDADRVERMLRGEQDWFDSTSSVDTADMDAYGAADAEAEPAETQAAMATVRAAPSRVERSALAPDPDIECVVMLRPAQQVPTAALGSAFSMSASRPVRWLGRRGPGLPWQALDTATSGPWQGIAACMVIAHPSGARSG